MYFWEAIDAQVSSLRFYSPPLVAADFKQSIADFTVSTFLPRSHQASRGSATINAIQGPCCCMKHGLARGWWCQGLSPAGFHKLSSALHVRHAQSSNLSVRGMHPWVLLQVIDGGSCGWCSLHQAASQLSAHLPGGS